MLRGLLIAFFAVGTVIAWSIGDHLNVAVGAGILALIVFWPRLTARTHRPLPPPPPGGWTAFNPPPGHVYDGQYGFIPRSAEKAARRDRCSLCGGRGFMESHPLPRWTCTACQGTGKWGDPTRAWRPGG